MNETLTLMLAGMTGAALGAIFFGGLWWTIRRGVSSLRPARLFFGSLLLRMGIALTGFYFVSGGDWRRLVACLAGFVAARLVMTWLTRPPAKNQTPLAPEVRHAP